MMQLIAMAFIVYVVTAFITSSSLVRPFRRILILKTPRLYSPFGDVNDIANEMTNGKHMIECRFCVSGWVSLITVLIYTLPLEWFTVWGISYFLVKLERK